MNIKYFYEFKGLDGVLNKVEILTSENVEAVQITPSEPPFVIEYEEIKKLDVVQGSGATLKLLSKEIFQFLDLHTDDMQQYIVKFYRDNVIFWVGFLDSELYSENLSDYPPYPVEFSAADFNILERLKYLDNAENKYTDIQPLIVHIKRCLDKLALPFSRLYVGCSTIPEGINIAATETALHKLYVQSANFYDEDGTPMTCREVINSILEPFSLMMIQRDACIYIYDYNTVKLGLSTKCYDMSLSYISNDTPQFQLGDISDIKTISTNSSFKFEELINNVKITCSTYAQLPFAKREVLKESLENVVLEENFEDYKKTTYSKCKNWDYNSFLIYEDKRQYSTIAGAKIPYSGRPSSTSDYFIPSKILEFNLNSEYVISSSKGYMLNLKLDVFFNGKTDPFDDEEELDSDERTALAVISCHLLLVDENGTPIKYYRERSKLIGDNSPHWYDYTSENDEYFRTGGLTLVYTGKEMLQNRMLNNWYTNSNFREPSSNESFWNDGLDKNIATGRNIILPDGASGFLRLVVLDSIRMYYPWDVGKKTYPPEKVKDLLINNFSATIVDKDGREISPVDFEFKSYINKKVSTDLEEKELKVVSCNEDMFPIGKANILRRVGNYYELQLKYTRANQTDILERLLMCTIHSNYTQKNDMISADLKMTDNPVMCYLSYNSILSKNLLVSGCVLDFRNAKSTVSAVGFSNDVDKLSSIPYE